MSRSPESAFLVPQDLLRVLRTFLNGQYKLVFVANVHVITGADGVKLLSMTEPETRILGFLEPARILQAP